MYIDACKVCMCVLVHPLDFNEILDIFKNKNCQIQLQYTISIIMLIIVALEANT